MDVQPGEGEYYELTLLDVRLYSDEHDGKIIEWREDCFLRAFGEDATLAVPVSIRLARRRDLDRERVEQLIRSGATPVQAARILL